MTYSVFVDGAAGTTGLEIAERLAGRQEFSLLILDEADRKDDSKRHEALHACDFAILCLPDNAARQSVAMAHGAKVRIIDASSAHRTAADWVYGFAELRHGQHEAIAGADQVSNPGCYPTGFLALVAPLVAKGLIPHDYPFSVNAVSGYSGGGKGLIARFEEQETDIAWRGYGYGLDHKHLPEMQVHAGLAAPPVFAPAVVPAYRGMAVEVPLHCIGNVAVPRALHAALVEHYAHSAVVSVADIYESPSEVLLHSQEPPNDGLLLRVASNADGSAARLVATLDNLGKGASGAAVQNLNIMAGLVPQAGLNL